MMPTTPTETTTSTSVNAERLPVAGPAVLKSIKRIATLAIQNDYLAPMDLADALPRAEVTLPLYLPA
jgi:hypothetical protein